MKLLFITLSLFFVASIFSQELTYKFAGVDAKKSFLECGKVIKVKMSVEGVEISDCEFKCVDTSVEIKRLNAHILEIKPTRKCSSVELTPNLKGKDLKTIEIPVYCYVKDQVILFGAKDGDTLLYSNLKSPLDLKIQREFTSENVELASFTIGYLKIPGVYVEVKFKSLSGDMMNKLIESVKRHKPNKISVMSVKKKVLDESTGEYKTIPVGSSVIHLK